ncbi:MAG: glycosyltransferase family 39 protein [Chloroflexota bacterium]|nr:glycosyltransferase family 39 protein [Chloroflexota bacterium]
MRPRAPVFELGLAGALAVGLALRLAVIASPLGEIDADEAVVGLMARHIAFLGERPVFYWGQPYIGSLEAFSAAALFRVFESGTLLLKLVPSAYSLGFLALSTLVARRLFGTGPALATAAYLAIPPSIWAVWSTKARGGYAEILCLGQAVLLVTLMLAQSPSRRLALVWGVLAGVAFWTHALAVVYLLPAVVFLVLARRHADRVTQHRRWSVAEVALAVGGGVIGMAPLIIENLAHGYLTLAALVQPADLPLDRPAQIVRFFRVGLPVLLGLGQPTTSAAMFDQDWLQRPAGHVWVAGAVVLVLAGVCVVHAKSLRRLVACGADGASEPALLLLLVLILPPVVALTRFGFIVSEPRYALPLYSAAPLVAGALWRVRVRLPGQRADVLRWAAVAAVLGFNVWSLVSTDVRLWRPEDTPDNTAATRSDLVRYLVTADRHQIYTDYWIGYPVMFETRETVLAYVISGGFNRYVPPADNVQRTPNPAWVFTPGMEAETVFLDELARAGGRAQLAEIGVYRVYTDVQPLAAVRPSGLISNPALGPPP